MLVHLDWTLPLVRGRSLPEPEGWENALECHSGTGDRVLLHGDPSPANVLNCGGGHFVLLDPPGAVIGPREADVGHLCAHLGGQEHVRLLIERAGVFDTGLDLARSFHAGP